MSENGWIEIMPVNSKGEYINLNEQDGRITYSRKVCPLPNLTPSHTSVADVRYMLFKGQKVDDWFLKPFRKWEKKFAKENPDQYNKIINMPSLNH